MEAHLVRETITTCGELVGVALILLSAFSISPAAGLGAIGVLVLALSALSA